ncbi:unnamed protein product, partial [Effrenium voratum]
MEPFEPSRPQDEVIQRPVMETLRQRIASWQQHATITGGRYQSGKSVATEEALRGARGVVRCTIESSDCKRMMFEELKVEDGALFQEVMRRAREKLKDFPDNLTKFPILLLEVPRTTTEGINLISSTAKDVATDKIGSAIHVIVSASSAAVALAFDAGGTERQEDIWVGDLTEEEAKEFLALHGHENKWEDFVDACGFRIGDLAKACENLKKGMDDTKQECQPCPRSRSWSFARNETRHGPWSLCSSAAVFFGQVSRDMRFARIMTSERPERASTPSSILYPAPAPTATCTPNTTKKD